MEKQTYESCSPEAIAMSVEDWYDKYMAPKVKQFEKHQRIAKLVTSLKAQAATAGR